MVRPLRLILALATVTSLAVASGCGSSSSSNTGSTATPTEATTAPATTASTETAPASSVSTAPAAQAGSSVAVEADPSGQLAYVQKSLTATAGSITFTFKNASPLPHNVTFENAGTEKEQGATKTITAGSASVTLTLPKGTYNYYCSVPGHEAAGMKGTLTVQ
jgi:plastocyanin